MRLHKIINRPARRDCRFGISILPLARFRWSNLSPISRWRDGTRYGKVHPWVHRGCETAPDQRWSPACYDMYAQLFTALFLRILCSPLEALQDIF